MPLDETNPQDTAKPAKQFREVDPHGVGASAAWLPIFAVPATIAAWQGWTVVMWVMIALAVMSLVFLIQTVLERNEPKYESILTFSMWPVPLGEGPQPILSVRVCEGVTDDHPVDVTVQLVCKEICIDGRSEDSMTRKGKFEETIVDIARSFTTKLVSGEAAVPLDLSIPLGEGAPTQDVSYGSERSSLHVRWHANVTIEPIGQTVMNDELVVGNFLIEAAQ